MQFRTREYALAIGIVLGAMVTPAQSQLPPPPPPPATLWSFLGVPQAYRGFRDSLNARGNRPGLERKPPMKAIADPSNLKSDVPAIKKAAEIKAQEDLAPQKIKAIKYLAGIGCGCYNRDGSITDALLKGMDDCTESVRLATVRAISEAAAGEACANCKQRSCCSEDISNKLYEIAYERDDTGCYLEPSERVRLSAAEALRTCCPGSDEDFIIESGPPPVRGGGGEQPGIAPEGGGERPGTVPPIGPLPTPAVPLQNTTPPGLPPLPPAPAPAAGSNPAPRSSRRTATIPEQPAAPGVQAAHLVRPLRFDQPQQNPHWSPGNIRQVTHSMSVSRGSMAFADAPIPDSVAAVEIVRANQSSELAPIVSKAAVKRLPPVDPDSSDSVGAPPLPPIATAAIPVSTRKSPRTSGDAGAPSVLRRQEPAAPTSTEQPKRSKPTTPMAQREIPGAQFGTGMVRSIRTKDGVALFEFANNAAVPPGSILRAYHEYALTGRTAICDLEVVRGEGGITAAVPRAGSELSALSVGDQAIVLR